jgi:hypothetical protein
MGADFDQHIKRKKEAAIVALFQKLVGNKAH